MINIIFNHFPTYLSDPDIYMVPHWARPNYPYDNPKIVSSVFAEHGSSGGAAGGPIIKKIVRYYKANYIKEKKKKDI